MNPKKLLFLLFFLYTGLVVTAQKYTNGVFVLNEDWFGHNNSTINFLNTETGEFNYYIVQENEANRGLSLGCTSQFGTIYGDNLYVVSKQDQDSGESPDKQGGRLVVADAGTMEIKKTIRIIAEKDGKSVADGRAFVGVDENKGYIGTSNGIYVIDLRNLEIKERIEGTENPLITGGEIPGNGTGPLYNNQIGIMIRSLDYVFAIQQDKGVLVINPETDKVEKIIEGCFSTMAQSKDGNIWIGKNSNMDYQKYPYGVMGERWMGNELLKINPATLETSIINVSAGGINHTWYAWTAGSLCASVHENALYFTYNNNPWSWFTTTEMYKYDVDNNSFTKIYDSSQEKRYFYGGAVRVNPLDDKLYASLYLDNNNQNYWIYQLDNKGKKLQEYEPIRRYWFTSLFIFPDNHAPEVADFNPVNLPGNGTMDIDLSSMAHDRDNLDMAITKRIISIDNENLVSASIKYNTLTVSALSNTAGTANITIRFNSNGKLVDKVLPVQVSSGSSIDNEYANLTRIMVKGNDIHIYNAEQGQIAEIYSLQGLLVRKQQINRDDIIQGLPSGQAYVLKIGNTRYKIIL